MSLHRAIARLSVNFPHAMNDALLSETPLKNGAFVVREEIGRGGSGFTYRARDVALGRDVAIKEFFPFGARREGKIVRADDIKYSMSRAAFVEEARALARFAHLNIVQVFGVWEENETAYLVTEFLDGQTWQQLVEARGFLPQDEALSLFFPVCEAVETVHQAEFLHGDNKPDNIISCRDGRVVLLDFGLTRPTSKGAHTTLLSPQNAQGTAGYAPLEQYSRLARTNPSSDVYALCATLWHLLSGQPPPDAPDRASGTPLPDLRAMNPSVSVQIEHVLHSGLAMDALARPQNAHELRTLLERNSLPHGDIAPPDLAISSTRLTPSFPTRPTVHDENAVAMLIVMSLVLFAAFFLVMMPHF